MLSCVQWLVEDWWCSGEPCDVRLAAVCAQPHVEVASGRRIVVFLTKGLFVVLRPGRPSPRTASVACGGRWFCLQLYMLGNAACYGRTVSTVT